MRRRNYGHNIVVREGWFIDSESSYNTIGREDMKLPSFVIEQLEISNLLEPILSYLRRIMTKNPIIQTQNIVCVPIGSPTQNWHYDFAENLNHFEEAQSYYTILIHLNHLDEQCGGTEIWNNLSQKIELVINYN